MALRLLPCDADCPSRAKPLQDGGSAKEEPGSRVQDELAELVSLCTTAHTGGSRAAMGQQGQGAVAVAAPEPRPAASSSAAGQLLGPLGALLGLSAAASEAAAKLELAAAAAPPPLQPLQPVSRLQARAEKDAAAAKRERERRQLLLMSRVRSALAWAVIMLVGAALGLFGSDMLLWLDRTARAKWAV